MEARRRVEDTLDNAHRNRAYEAGRTVATSMLALALVAATVMTVQQYEERSHEEILFDSLEQAGSSTASPHAAIAIPLRTAHATTASISDPLSSASPPVSASSTVARSSPSRRPPHLSASSPKLSEAVTTAPAMSTPHVIVSAPKRPSQTLQETDDSASASNETNSASSPSNATSSADQPSSSGGAADSCPLMKTYPAYFVQQRFWTMTNVVDVYALKSKGGKEVKKRIASVQSRAFSFSAEEDLYGRDGALILSSHQDVITTVTNIYIDDCTGEPFAKISEQNHQRNSAVSQYTIQNADGDVIATSNMQRNYGTEVDVTDQLTGKRLWSASTPWLQIADSWSMTVVCCVCMCWCCVAFSQAVADASKGRPSPRSDAFV